MISLLLAASHATGPHSRSPRLWLALLPLVFVALAFDVYCLVDLVRAQSVRHLPKIVWGLIIVCISFPFGGLAYLFLGRVRNQGTRVPD